jgi:hypothetical protein
VSCSHFLQMTTIIVKGLYAHTNLSSIYNNIELLILMLQIPNSNIMKETMTSAATSNMCSLSTAHQHSWFLLMYPPRILLFLLSSFLLIPPVEPAIVSFFYLLLSATAARGLSFCFFFCCSFFSFLLSLVTCAFSNSLKRSQISLGYSSSLRASW